MDNKAEKQILKLLRGLKTDVGILKTEMTDLTGDVKVLTKIAHSTAVKVSEHELALTQFVTKDEFAVFKSENAGAHDRTVKTLEKLEQEFKAFNRAHSRLEGRVDEHQRVLVRHQLLEAPLA